VVRRSSSCRNCKHFLGEPGLRDRHHEAPEPRRQRDEQLDAIGQDDRVHDGGGRRHHVEAGDPRQRDVHAIVAEIVPQLGDLEGLHDFAGLDEEVTALLLRQCAARRPRRGIGRAAEEEIDELEEERADGLAV
jgi:hypothetical protein